MNNICIYAEVIALARFFLGLLLSPQTLNIQLPSPVWGGGGWGCSDHVRSPHLFMEGEEAEQGKETPMRCVGAVEARALDFPLQLIPLRHLWEGDSGAEGLVLVLNP